MCVCVLGCAWLWLYVCVCVCVCVLFNSASNSCQTSGPQEAASNQDFPHLSLQRHTDRKISQKGKTVSHPEQGKETGQQEKPTQE